MISIIIEINKKHLRIKAEGHALFDKKGKDIVCASVSVLVESWLLSEKELCKAEVGMNRKNGFLEAEVIDYKDQDVLLFKSMALSLIALEQQYPENIKVFMEDDHGR